MKKLTKQKIKQTLKDTKLKRRSQRCKVFILKIDQSRLNSKELEQLKMFFIEAKWLYNNVLASKDPFHYNYKNTTVTVYNKDKQLEQRQLSFLSARVRYDIIKQTRQNIINLSKAKTVGLKIGELKFKSDINSINLYHYKTTHRIVDNNHIKIASIKRPLIVKGLKQIQNHYELANAKLLKKPSGYYIAITCYEFIIFDNISKSKKIKEVGLDFGIKNNITTSEAEIYNVRVEESERLKRLQRQFAKKQKRSNNSYKTKLLIRKEYEKLTNKKVDAANKIVHALLTNYTFIYIQDENIKSWHSDRKKKFSKVVQHSCMGLIKSKLSNSSKVKVISKWYPSTKQCYICNRMNDIGVSRTYSCECGLVEDRDVKAAKTIMMFGKNQLTYARPVVKKNDRVPMESREFKSVEKMTTGEQVLNRTSS